MLKKLILMVPLLLSVVFGSDDSTKIKFSGWGFFTFGRVEKSPTEATGGYDINFEKEWLSDFDAGLKAVAFLGKNTKARLHLGVSTAYLVLAHDKDNAEFLRRRTVPYMIDAAIEHTLTFGNNTLFSEFGFFPVKYNPEVTNLGEYLFRSGTYPAYVSSGFELADKEKLTGLHTRLRHNFSEKSHFRADLFFTNDMRDFPIHDFSLSYILGAGILDFVDVAAGLQNAHFISLDDRKTTPATDTLVFPSTKPKYRNVAYVDSNGNVTKYTFRGTKGMLRMSLNPQALVKIPFMGAQDLKVYGEVALLGFKNYPGWYENREERIPAMFGMNLPTHPVMAYGIAPAIGFMLLDDISKQGKIGSVIGCALSATAFTLLEIKTGVKMGLDLLSAEMEYYGSKYWNSPENAWTHRSPLPYYGSAINDLTEVTPRTNDDWKWSVYASKKIGKHFKLSAQVASDHILRTPYMPPPPSFAKYTEIVPRTGDWYWMTRAMFYF